MPRNGRKNGSRQGEHSGCGGIVALLFKVIEERAEAGCIEIRQRQI
jgi:hypothetical protein